MKHLNYADKIKIAEKVARKRYTDEDINDSDDLPQQLNFQCIIYDKEEYYIAEYMKSSGAYSLCTTCFSDEDAENIYKNGLTKQDIKHILSDNFDDECNYDEINDYYKQSYMEALLRLPY